MVADALTAKITTLPTARTRTLTWDHGHEMAAHARFTIDTGMQVYFCDPKSPWQRVEHGLAITDPSSIGVPYRLNREHVLAPAVLAAGAAGAAGPPPAPATQRRAKPNVGDLMAVVALVGDGGAGRGRRRLNTVGPGGGRPTDRYPPGRRWRRRPQLWL